MMKNITLKQVLRQHALLGCIALLPLSPVYSQADNQQIAFPGAEGWGRFATGGRTTDPAIGSKVYYVTSLDDYLSSEEPIEGTLRWALTTGDDTPRTILFKVGGTINLKERLKCPRPNVTIAGQSAPGGGICISGANIYIHSKNFIVRYIRFRAGDLSGSNYSALGIENTENIIIDHCSFSWSMEENVTMYDNKYTTMQWCILSEPLYVSKHDKGARGYGAQWGGEHSTFHHNLFAHCVGRTPLVNGARDKSASGHDAFVDTEIINNVHFNWGNKGALYGGQLHSIVEGAYSRTNLINNYYKPGPATPSGTHYFFNQSLQRDGATSLGPSKWHFSGNIMEGDDAVTADNWKGFKNSTSYSIDDIKVDTIIQTSGDHDHQKYHYDWDTYTYKNYETAAEAYESVLAAVGAWPRDLIDTRIVKSVREGLAPYGNHGIIDLPSQAEGPLAYDTFDRVVDSDGDGMDDAWELANGLSPADPADGNSLTELGYTALEVYLNSLVGENIKHDFSTVGIQSEHADQRLELASTIVTEELEILCDEDLDGAYIYTINGTRIMGVKIEGGKTLSVSGLESGYYIIAVYTKAGDAKIAKFLKK